MRAFVATIWILIALLILPAIALADWSDNFDSYTLGGLAGQGGWELWPGGGDATVTDVVSRSAPNSAMIAGVTDVIHAYTGYTSGKWFFTTWHYVPSSMTGVTYFIIVNTWPNPTQAGHWSVQLGFDSSTGLILADCGDVSSSPVNNLSYLTDQWVEIRCFIDLDEDWVQVYYNGQLLDDPDVPDHPILGGGCIWTMGIWGSGGGLLNIGAVDLFANGATDAYFDDLSLSPATIWADIKVNGRDAPADITVGQNAVVSIAFVAGDEFQNDGDVFVALTTPLSGQFAKLTYDGVGGIGGTGWHPGLTYELASGPLSNHFDIALDWTMGNALQGDFKAYLAADGIANGLPDIGSLLVIDSVDFTVVGQ